MAITRKAQRRVDRLLRSNTTRPLLAAAAFLAPSAITAVGTWLNVDHFLVVIPAMAACFASVLLCVQLLGGNIVSLKWFLAAALLLTVSAGHYWYVIISVSIATLLWLYAIDQLVGPFAPVFYPSSKGQRVFPRFDRSKASTSG